MEYIVSNEYGDTETCSTLESAREVAEDWVRDQGYDEIYDTPVSISMIIPVETYLQPRPIVPEVVCTCATVRTCVVVP